MKLFGTLFTSLIFSLTFWGVAHSSVNQSVQFEVEKFQLDNGLTVLVHVDRSMPIISYQQWFRVGSSNEKPGRTGLAHFFEHLMFKGTKKYPKGEIDKIIQMNGGSNNAFTTEDYTGYYTNLPSDKLELIIDVESDRMRNLIFDEKEINSEREVVKEERRMRYENSVYGSLFLQIRNTLYKTSAYRWPVIGYMKDLNATNLAELKEFYNTYYAPNNAVVVVAGDVSVSEVKKLMKKYYGGIPRQTLPDLKLTPETEQRAARYSKLEKDVQGVTLAIVYPGVPVGHPDAHALDLMTSALGAGSSSRMYKRLVYKNQLATDVSMSNSNDKLSGEISTYVSLKPGVTANAAQALVNSEIAKIKSDLVSPDELQKLKNQIKLGYVKGLQTMASRARALALNEVYFNDYKVLFEDLEKYEKITAEDIQRVAKTYLVPGKKNVVQISPKSVAGVTQ
ncbi:MAG: insulinase family protein [Bdellovibrionales bacterium]|nr:insulinase family protein [Bdellovibrionales bacterium]